VEAAGSLVLTETVYEPGMRLPSHSHGSDHLAILLEGSYLERTGKRTYLCFPGDAVHYQTDVHHDNLFGARPGRCLNFEFQPGDAPEACRANGSYVPEEIRMLLSSSGKRASRETPVWLNEARTKIDTFPSYSMSSLAAQMFVHPNHLAKSFRKAFGMSVGQYAMLARLRGVAQMLIGTDASIAEIAFDSGFFDQSHLSNALLRVTGFTPAGLRRVAHP
jgi:AraC family transcriptional regulator